jgi:hypothetical protein
MRIDKLLSIILFVVSTNISFCQKRDIFFDNYNQGMKLYDKGEFQKALPYFEKVTKLDPNCDYYFNTACVASLSNNLDKGFTYLELAIRNGYADTAHLKEDNDIANLKSDKRWSKTSFWLKQTKESLLNEIAKLNTTCPASNLIPYKKNGKWGYLNKQTKLKVTEPVFGTVSFIGKTGSVKLGHYQINFSCSGKVDKLEILIGVEEAVSASYSPYYTVSTDIKRGFTVSDGSIKTHSSLYNSFYGFNISSGKNFAIVGKENKYDLIDSTGECQFNLKGYSSLLFYNFGRDSKYLPNIDTDGEFLIFFKNSLKQIGYVNNRFDKIILPEATDFKKPKGNGFEREYLDIVRKYAYLEQNNKWGIWDCETKKWLIRPEYDDIILTDRTFDGNEEEKCFSGNSIDFYFLVKQNNKEFFIDLKNNKYTVK